MARLLGISTLEVQLERRTTIESAAQKFGSTVVLKGARSLIAGQGYEIFVSPWDVPALAVAGTGDVLAGVTGALLARNYPNHYAASVAVAVHAQAGIALTQEAGGIYGHSALEVAAMVSGVLNVWSGVNVSQALRQDRLFTKAI